MKVACELCGEVAEAALRVEGEAIAVTCAACGGTFRAEMDGRTASRAPEHAGPSLRSSPSCPKCGTPSTGDGPCPRCGLTPAHAAAWIARAAEPPTASLGAAWDAAVAAWSDEPTHERAASIAIETGDYAWLAARYRAIQRERPGDPVARRQLERLARRAEATLRATATPPARERAVAARVPFGVLIAIVLVVGIGLVYAIHVVRQQNDESRGRVERIAPSPSRR